MSDKLSNYINQKTPPPVIDPDHYLTDKEIKHLNNQITNLSYPAHVVLVPSDSSYANLEELSADLEKQWGMNDGKVIFLLDMKKHTLGFVVSPKLEAKGVSHSEVADRILPYHFSRHVKEDNVAKGIEESLQAIDNRLNGVPVKGYKTETRSERPHESANYAHFTIFYGALFVAIVVLIVITLRLNSGPRKEIDLRKSRDKYIKKMEQLKALFENNPQQYFLRVIGLICLGYAYIAVVLLILICLTILAFVLLVKVPYLAVKLGIPLLLLIGVIFRSFWIKQPPVEGRYLSRRDYPKLYQVVDQVRKQIQAPKVHAIHLIPDMNAMVRQVPRLGMFGWHKNYMFIGLELLKSFSYDEARSVIAHELGHLAGNHGAKSAWFYQVQMVWDRLMDSLNQDESFATLMFTRFFNWFVPELGSYTFLYMREQEYNADLCSVDLVGKDKAAMALIGLNIKSQYLHEKYWSAVAENYSKREPPKGIYAGITDAIRKDVKPHNAEIWLSEALRRETDYEDSHPCLTDRVAAILNVAPKRARDFAHAKMKYLLDIDRTAFDELFEDKADALCESMEEEWRLYIKDYWADRHQYYLERKDILEEQRAKALEGALTDEEAVEYAYNAVIVEGFDVAKPIFEAAIERKPEDAELRQIYGEWLLDSRDDSCVAQLESAMSLDRYRVRECGLMLYSYYKSRDDNKKADHYEEMMIDWSEEYYKGQLERADIKDSDSFISHDLKPEQEDKLREEIRNISSIEHAYVVRKDVTAFKEISQYVLVVKVYLGAFEGDEKRVEAVDQLIEQVEFPAEFMIMNWKHSPKNLKEACEKFGNAILF